MNKETLEEAAKEFVLSHDFSKLTNPNHLANRCFQFGAKWMQETTLKEHNYLQGFINQFEEEGEYQELSNNDWTVSSFLEWMKLNNFKIIKI